MSDARDRQGSAPTDAGGAARRLSSSLTHYRRRAWRWGRLVAEFRPGTARPRPGARRVLVVRLDAIGDFVLWSGAARVLRRWLGPDAHVTLAANARWADLARDTGLADDVWAVEREPLEWNPAYRAELRARVSRAQFALAIHPVHAREMMLGDSLVRWTRAAERIGSAGDDALLPPHERRWADRWYTRRLPVSATVMHESERHAEFLRALGVPFEGVPAPAVDAHVPLPGQLGSMGDGYFVIFPGAGSSGREWAPRDFADAARYVRQKTGWRPVVLGTSHDAPAARIVTNDLPGAVDLTGETSVTALCAAIGHAMLVLTNETSAVHLAAAAGVPSVCIAGGGHWRRFVPYPASLGAVSDLVEVVSMEQEMSCFNCNWRCVLPHVSGEALPCVGRVSLERVLGAVDRVLSRMMVTLPNG